MAILSQARYTALRDEVFESLQQAILDGRLAAGTRLVEADVAADLNVSKTPVREAIIRLERLGLVVSHPRRGTFVATVGPSILLEIFVARGLIEGYVAARAATRASEDDLARMQALIAVMADEDARGDRAAVTRTDIAFHDLIYQTADNALLLQIWRGFRDRIRLCHRIQPRNAGLVEVPCVRDLHQDILDALQSRDPRAARLAAEIHLHRGLRLHGVDHADDMLAALGTVDGPAV